jgi:pilus assembly protein Flp/PilA
MKFAKVLKGTRLGPWLVAVLCALLLTYTSPRKAEATAVEYAVMLALIIVVCITAITADSPGTNHAYTRVGDQLKAAVNSAFDANSDGDTPKEIAGLSKTIGALKAMIAMASSSCEDSVTDCTMLRENLQKFIGVAGERKAQALSAVGCNINGVIQGNEQCDPLAPLPNGGCPATTFPTFCSDECLCVPVVTP